MSAPLKLLSTKPQKATRTSVDTIRITSEIVGRWEPPPFQRPLRINEKVRTLALQIKQDGGVLPGVITLGILDGREYLLDGQHRREAFVLSEVPEGFTDVRRHVFDTMAEMGLEFVNLNSQLVRMRPDDILRGLEGSTPALRYIREHCPFVGYDMIRRGASGPIVSMAQLLAAWCGSAAEVPTRGGDSALHRASQLTTEEAEKCVEFLGLCMAAWGRDLEYQRLWGSLNLTLCAWLFRRLVLKPYSARSGQLSKDAFLKCLMALSARTLYLEWLVGRNLSERDRSPAFMRIKQIFVTRLQSETGHKPALPQPGWVSKGGKSTGRV